MATWVEDTVQAIANLGGVASLRDIYEEVRRIRVGVLPPSLEESIRATLHDYSSDSAGFMGRKDLFFSQRKGSGVWGLRDRVLSTPPANDLEEPEPQRVRVLTYRVLRDTLLSRTLKALHQNACQICGQAVQLLDGSTYSEAHHIKPLGKNGPDVAENILVLCPNHHVMCDYGAIELDVQKLRKHPDHQVGAQYIAYHNAAMDRGSDQGTA